MRLLPLCSGVCPLVLFHPRRQRAFTLIELMITVAVIAILAAVAYPSYTQHLIKGSRSAAQSYLLELAQRQQLNLMTARRYESSVAALTGGSTPAEVDKYYTISIAVTTTAPPTFTLTAAPKDGTRQVGDGDLTIDQAGQRLWGTKPW